jgi:hypothetical protein
MGNMKENNMTETPHFGAYVWTTPDGFERGTAEYDKYLLDILEKAKK